MDRQSLVNGHPPATLPQRMFDSSRLRASPASPAGSSPSPGGSSSSTTDQRLMHEKLSDMGKYLPLPYPPSVYSGLMGHMPFLMPNASGPTSWDMAAMRQLHASLGQQNHRLLTDAMHDSPDSVFTNGGSSLIKSPKARRFTPYSVPSVTSSADSAFYRLATGHLSSSKAPETDSPITKDSSPSPTKVWRVVYLLECLFCNWKTCVLKKNVKIPRVSDCLVNWPPCLSDFGRADFRNTFRQRPVSFGQTTSEVTCVPNKCENRRVNNCIINLPPGLPDFGPADFRNVLRQRPVCFGQMFRSGVLKHNSSDLPSWIVQFMFTRLSSFNPFKRQDFRKELPQEFTNKMIGK